VTPTWYDLLGVEPDASPEEIRTAWKSGIADLEPGDRRFRTLNEAAEVLLDPDRRAAYDAQLAPDTVVEVRGAPATPVLRSERASLEGSLETSAAEAPTARTASTGVITDLEAEKARTRAEAKAAKSAARDDGKPASTRGTVPAWLLGALAALVALLLACAGYLLTQPADAAVADATREAQSSAERAATTILAYDYRHLDEDQQAAGELMTPGYRKKYDALFAQIAANAPDLKVVVTVDVVASGVVRSGDDRVQVLVFANRPTLRRDQAEPEIFRDQVVMTMVKSGGDWLVDDMDTNQLAG
jgi:Mce-associated membrane protein